MCNSNYMEGKQPNKNMIYLRKIPVWHDIILSKLNSYDIMAEEYYNGKVIHSC